MKPKPQRGEVWMVDLGMAAKVRPALVLSVAALEDERHLYGIVPHTTSPWDTRFEAVVNVPWLKAGAFDAQGFRPVPLVAFQRNIGKLNAAQVAEVEQTMLRWIGVTAS